VKRDPILLDFAARCRALSNVLAIVAADFEGVATPSRDQLVAGMSELEREFMRFIDFGQERGLVLKAVQP
jgi:hypothetical protein